MYSGFTANSKITVVGHACALDFAKQRLLPTTVRFNLNFSEPYFLRETSLNPSTKECLIFLSSASQYLASFRPPDLKQPNPLAILNILN